MKKLEVCSDCKKLIGKHKPWDENKVPEVAVIDNAECRKCNMSYSIYKGMIWPVPFATPKETKEIEKSLGRI